MNTFLPQADFWYSAACLDRLRLGKQRVEILQILNALSGKSKGWINHPAVRMWKGYEGYLAYYGEAICNQWIKRGYKDTLYPKMIQYIEYFKDTYVCPPWLGDERFHSSHRAALLKKNYQWYSQFGWKEEPEINYYWPVKK